MTPLIETLEINLWLKFLADATMKSFVIFAVAGLLEFILHRHSAAVRGLVWTLAIVGCLIMPLFSLTLPRWEVGVLPATSERFEMDRLTDNRQAAISSVPTASRPLPSASRPLPSTTAPSTQIAPPLIQSKSASSESGAPQPNMSGAGFTWLHWTDWLAVCWAGGTLFLIVRLIVGIGAVWYISLRSNAFSISIPQVHPDWTRPVSIRQSDAVTVPMVWGLFRPVILLPANVDELGARTAARCAAARIGTHPTAGLVDADNGTNNLCCVYWFNPLIWFGVRRMRTEIGACM